MATSEPTRTVGHSRHRQPDAGGILFDAAVRSVAGRYTKLILIVGAERCHETHLLSACAEGNRTSVTNVGLEMTQALLEVPSRRRPVAAADLATDLCRGSAGDGIRFVDHIEALFLPELQLNPLRILQDAARNRIVVAAWPGTFDGVVLRYGRSGHPEFREYRTPDIVHLDAAMLARGVA